MRTRTRLPTTSSRPPTTRGLPPRSKPPAPAQPAEPDYVAELEKLAQLKGQGLISDEDYEAKKKQILGI